MSSVERPIGAAKGKQSDTEALCQPPPRQHQAYPLLHFLHDHGCHEAPCTAPPFNRGAFSLVWSGKVTVLFGCDAHRGSVWIAVRRVLPTARAGKRG